MSRAKAGSQTWVIHMIMKGISRRSLLRGSVGALAAAGGQSVCITFDAKAAESIRLTLPWIPEGEVAFMYAAQKEGFWAKRGLDVTITGG
jgi:ABC-type nitrate/sulfonate/bicarbonate transport system substrate-binding protein